MTKPELIDAIATGAGIPKTKADAALSALVDAVVANVTKGNTVRVPGLGTWKRANRKARVGRNPQTGAPVKIPARKVPQFSAASGFRDGVGGVAKKPAKKPAKKVAKKR
ncbi:MAG: HU family DNA-binding protein [Actinobacteria bacterium]|nr:HU family DNA-binding protein [Actinomycetota bacterium]